MSRHLALLVVGVLVSTTARAQQTNDLTPSPPPAQPAASAEGGVVHSEEGRERDHNATDFLRLTNGGIVRGVIQISSPGRYVEILTSSGERLRFAASEISYAGSMSDEPSRVPSPPSAVVSSPVVPSPIPPTPEAMAVRLRSTREGMTFYRELASGTQLEATCTAPCEVSLPAGQTSFALTIEGLPLAWAEPVNVRPGATYFGEFYSRRGVRIAGAVILAASALMAIPLLALGTMKCRDSQDDCSAAPRPQYLVPGLFFGIAGTSSGVGMMFARDRAIIWEGANVPPEN